MFQHDLFSPRFNPAPGLPTALSGDSVASSAPAEPMTLPGLLERLSQFCQRPRYSFMVLNLIAQASADTGSAGPYVAVADRRIPVRDWLCEALMPIAQHETRRQGVIDRARKELDEQGLALDGPEAEERIQAEVLRRVRRSGLANVSRAVSELVRAGLVRRHYQGYRVDHCNRGAQRQAVYTVTEEARAALI